MFYIETEHNKSLLLSKVRPSSSKLLSQIGVSNRSTTRHPDFPNLSNISWLCMLPAMSWISRVDISKK